MAGNGLLSEITMSDPVTFGNNGYEGLAFRRTEQVTESDIARNLMFVRYRTSFVLPRYTPARWWEADVFEITRAGYFREYEIKLTRADFLADAEKRKEQRFRRVGLPTNDQTKHERVQQGDPAGPSQFWFVTPAGLLTPEMVPPWAGLIEMCVRRPGKPLWMHETVVKVAPRLHREKFELKRRRHAESVLYYRLHQIISGMTEIPDDPAVRLREGAVGLRDWLEGDQAALGIDIPDQVYVPFLNGLEASGCVTTHASDASDKPGSMSVDPEPDASSDPEGSKTISVGEPDDRLKVLPALPPE